MERCNGCLPLRGQQEREHGDEQRDCSGETGLPAWQGGPQNGYGIEVIDSVVGVVLASRSGLAVWNLFFQDLSSTIIEDDVIQRLVSFHNVIVTGHQAFFSQKAIGQSMQTTIESISALESGTELVNRVPVVRPPHPIKSVIRPVHIAGDAQIGGPSARPHRVNRVPSKRVTQARSACG